MTDHPLTLPAKPVALGTVIRSGVGGNPMRVGGYLMRFWPEDKRDTYQTYFDAKTNYRLDDYRIEGMPMLFQHGLDPKIGVEPVGRFDSFRVDEWGIWAEGLLDERRQYIAYIKHLVDAGVFDFSGRCLDESLIVDQRTGHVEQWCFIEGSLTHTPGDWRSVIDGTGTRIQPLRALLASVPPIEALAPTEVDAREASRAMAEEAPGNEAGDTVAGTTAAAGEDAPAEPQGGEMSPDEIQALVKQLVAELLAEAGISKGEEAVAEAAMVEAMPEVERSADLTQEHVQSLIDVALTKVEAERNRNRAAVRAALNNARGAEGQSRADAAGGFRANGTAPQQPRISVSEDRQFSRYSAADMAMAVKLKEFHLRKAGLSNVNPLEQIGDDTDYRESFTRTLAGRVSRDVHEKPVISRPDELSSLRSAIPFRANEIDNTGGSGYGADWVGTYYDAVLWEKAREVLIFEQLVAKGMQSKEIGPNGVAKFFTEGADPTVYTARQSNSVDATGRPEATANIGTFGTGVVTMTPGEWKVATSYTVNLSEDSPLDLAQAVNNQLRAKLMETIEQGILNGDTATAANTNINLIDDTPGTGLSKPYYLAFDGMLKLPLVTNTGQSRAAAATLGIRDFLLTLAELPDKLQAHFERLAFIVDARTYLSCLQLAELATDDVRRTGGTFTDGTFSKAWGIDVMRSGMMALANSAGKVPVAGGTLGRILLTYAPYWGFAYKRNITIESDRDIISGTNVYVGSLRMGLVNFDNTAAAVTYNVPVIG